jgi:DNA-directed RNA polymerase specialized sigma24 family protein
MKTLNVKARPWRGGWELEIDPENITQVRKLRNARQQVIDFLDTVESNIDHSSFEIVLVPDLGELGNEVLAARAATRRAAELQKAAASQTRLVVSELRAQHFSGGDIAELLGVSVGRVSQLAGK